jgi:hypothetical protein
MINDNKTTKRIATISGKLAPDLMQPPRSERFTGEQIFTERYVKMHGNDYYMRLFHNGASEFVRFDTTAKKWVFLLFPAA